MCLRVLYLLRKDFWFFPESESRKRFHGSGVSAIFPFFIYFTKIWHITFYIIMLLRFTATHWQPFLSSIHVIIVIDSDNFSKSFTRCSTFPRQKEIYAIFSINESWDSEVFFTKRIIEKAFKITAIWFFDNYAFFQFLHFFGNKENIEKSIFSKNHISRF